MRLSWPCMAGMRGASTWAILTHPSTPASKAPTRTATALIVVVAAAAVAAVAGGVVVQALAQVVGPVGGDAPLARMLAGAAKVAAVLAAAAAAATAAPALAVEGIEAESEAEELAPQSIWRGAGEKHGHSDRRTVLV